MAEAEVHSFQILKRFGQFPHSFFSQQNPYYYGLLSEKTSHAAAHDLVFEMKSVCAQNYLMQQYTLLALHLVCLKAKNTNST